MVEVISKKDIERARFTKKGKFRVIRRKDTSPPYALAKRENHFSTGYHVHLEQLIFGKYQKTGFVFSKRGEIIFGFPHGDKRRSSRLTEKLGEVIPYIKPYIVESLGKFSDEVYLPIPENAAEVFCLKLT